MRLPLHGRGCLGFGSASRRLQIIDHGRFTFGAKSSRSNRRSTVFTVHSYIDTRRELESLFSDPLTDLSFIDITILYNIGYIGITIVKQVLLNVLEKLFKLFATLRANGLTANIIEQSSASLTILNIH